MAVPRAQAQDPPDAPTGVAVYSTSSGELDVRWSSSDGAPYFFVQWKSGTEEYDDSDNSTRQDRVAANFGLVPPSSTETTKRYKHRIVDLTDDTEYTVRVIAIGADGNSDPSSEASGTPQSTPAQDLTIVENELVSIHESDHPWLREALDFLTDQSAPLDINTGISGSVDIHCDSSFQTDGLRPCRVRKLTLGIGSRFFSASRAINVFIHELAHVYTLASNVTMNAGPVAAAHLYFNALSFFQENPCQPYELYADVLSISVHGTETASDFPYWRRCPEVTDSTLQEALGVVRGALGGTTPSWLSTHYDAGGGELDLERLWVDARTMPGVSREPLAYMLHDSFGGYCDNRKATLAASLPGAMPRNPWKDGGCVPDAPGSVAATPTGSGKLTVSWSAPTNDGGSQITGYKVQWKSSTEEFEGSRQASVTDLTRLQHETSGLTNGVAYTLRVLAVNDNGDGDPSSETTATTAATDTATPTLLAAQVDSATLTLTWNEALDESSEPATNDFTASVAGNNRGVTDVAVSGNAVTLTLASAVGVGDAVTVTYTVPTGTGANPIRGPGEQQRRRVVRRDGAQPHDQRRNHVGPWDGHDVCGE